MTPHHARRMGRFLVLAVRCTFLAALLAQQPAGGRGRGRGGVVSPEVAANGAVTFRFQAPNAREVSVSGTWGGPPTPMAKDAGGVWTATVGPLPPDIYTYSFSADGVTALDPGNTNTKMGYGPFGPVSVVQVPGINHTYVVGEGAHEWTVWRHHLRDGAPLLFK